MSLYRIIKRSYKTIADEIERLEKLNKDSPPGSIQAEKHRDRYRFYYLKEDGSRELIKLRNRTLAEKLAFKTYVNKRLKDLTSEKTAIEFYLRHHEPEKTPVFLDKHPGIKSLLGGYISDREADYKSWTTEDYISNSSFPEHKKYRAENGLMVRSKSEMLIVSVLIEFGLAFRYEPEMYFNGHLLCPDFVIKHPETGETIIWEHFGMMDDENYRKNAAEKIRTYMEAGYYLGINLIITSETEEYPFDSIRAKSILTEYIYN